MNAKLKFGIHQLAVYKSILANATLNYIGRYKILSGAPEAT